MRPEQWGPGDRKYQAVYERMEKPKAHGVLDFFSMNLLGWWSGNRHAARLEQPMQNGPVI